MHKEAAETNELQSYDTTVELGRISVRPQVAQWAISASHSTGHRYMQSGMTLYSRADSIGVCTLHMTSYF